MINEKLKDMHIKQKVMIIFSILLGVYIVAVLVGIIGLSVMGENPTARMVALVLLIVIAVVNLVMVLKLGGAVVLSLVGPVKELEEAAKRMAVGDFSTEITYRSNDELGQLADCFRATSSTLKEIIDDLFAIIAEFTRGNFDVRSKCEDKYVGDYAPLLTQLREMVRTYPGPCGSGGGRLYGACQQRPGTGGRCNGSGNFRGRTSGDNDGSNKSGGRNQPYGGPAA